ncbi:MAG: bifunctional folylpolyglutamate synthase/dihydrofolate synthase [Dehalococcoidales bacterium]|nr:bifunctional folylpolyglutamate synthase/dihydrofolate synthase [Dehalococcoidales bacterium]
MKYEQARDYILGYTDYEKIPLPHALGSYDLRRVEELLARLGNPHLAAKSVHIAGTNGKGSTAAMISSVLTSAGYATGLYTSPHLITIRERFQVNGRPISRADFARITTRLKPEVEAVNLKATYGELTTFELLTALAFSYFQAKGVDFQVLEVGMGGNFDATNVIRPEVCVITSISLDHTEVLGDSLAKIAAEKAGIIKPGSRVVLAPQPNEVVPVIEEDCRRKQAELIMVGREVSGQSLGFDGKKQLLEITGRLDSYRISLPLLGGYQMENAASAVAALEVLKEKGYNITRDSIANGLARVSWPGRLQVLRRRPLVVVDGAHNPGAAHKLGLALKQYFKFERATLIMGASSDKNVSAVVSELAPLFDEVIITRSAHPRAMETARLKAVFEGQGKTAQVTGDVPEALALALDRARVRDLVCVSGSLFVVAEAISWLKRRRGK